MLKASTDLEYSQSAELLADCYRAVSNMRMGIEFTASDVCERLDRSVQSNAVAKKLRRMKELECKVGRNGVLHFKKVREVWY